MEELDMNLQEKVKGYLDYCQFRKELDLKTLKAYRIDLQQYFEYVGNRAPLKEQIEEYITELHKKYKQKTVKRKIASLKAFYTYLEEMEIIQDNVMHHIRTKFKEENVLPRIIPREEIEKLLNYMYKKLKDGKEIQAHILRNIAIVEIFFATGARVYEVANIRWENINLNSGVIRFRGKGGKERIIQVAEKSALNILRRYYNENKNAIHRCGYFFVNQRGSRYTEQSIREMLKKNSSQAGIKRNITPHMFRHSFATYLIEDGVDVSCVQQILGHSSIKTTQIYIHLATKKQADILRKLHPRNKMKINVA